MDIYQVATNLVHEFTFIHASYLPKIETIELHVYVYIWQFLQSVRKEIKAPIALVQDKKKNEDNKSKFYILQMAVANLIKFAVWPTLPGGQL